jgi:hypothetical protein
VQQLAELWSVAGVHVSACEQMGGPGLLELVTAAIALRWAIAWYVLVTNSNIEGKVL